VFGRSGGPALEDPATDPAAVRAGLVAAAITFFLAVLDDPPVELEATHADVAGLVRSLATSPTATESDAERLATREAVDAIDDGLPADAVALRLQRLLPPGADAVTILRDRLDAAG
jgi:hypothetical protein